MHWSFRQWTMAFFRSVLTLVLAKGAGPLRRTLGVAFYLGMPGVTFSGIFLTPIFYYVLQSSSEWWNGGVHQRPEAQVETTDIRHSFTIATVVNGPKRAH